MQSLRTRRSQAPPRKAPRQGTVKLAKPGTGPTRRETAGKSRVDDKIKKRMSMRYADISSPTELGIPPMPTIPDMPGRGTIGRGQDEVVRDRTGAMEDARVAADDKQLLDKDDFDPDAFLKIKLANSTEAELKSLQSSLRNAKGDIATDLQQNVFKNYAEFVLISKEISTLENEMLELKESLSEYKSMPSLLHIPDPSSTSSSSLSSYRRSSVADLRIMYFNQMQTLHAQIEGSAKFAPTTPGRHVVGEVDGVLALNSATYKVMGKVKFVVLDDAVLVARRRRRATGGGGEGRRGGESIGEGKLVAERCWPLNEMLVLDTKDSPSMTNVFKIRHGKETHVFRTESPADKKTLLQQLRHVADELSAKKRKEREGEHERRKSMWNGGDRNKSTTQDRMPPVPDWMADLASKAGEPPADGKAKAERDTQWTDEWADELTVAIALREWEKATKLVEDGKAKLPTIPPLASKLTPLTTQLTSSLLTSLALPSNRKSTVVSLITLLLRLNAGPAARNTFLTMRTQVLRSHVRKIKFEGHVGAYVGDLAVVYFTGIKHTADWFLASFKENEVASAFIDWTKTQIESYSEMFRRQVYSSDVDPMVVEEAMKITYSQSKKLLEEFGLDFRYLLNELLVEKPKETTNVSVPFSLRGKNLAPKVIDPSLSLTIAPPPPISASYSRRSPLPRSQTSSSTSSKASTSSTLTTPTPTPGLAVPLSGYSTSSAYTPSAATSAFPSQAQMPPPPPSGYRSRTPSSAAAPPFSGGNTTPLSAPTPAVPLASPAPRRARSPPLSASPLRPGTAGSIRERQPRVPRQSGSPAPPPRSSNRPGSAISHRPPPVAVPQREGMI